MKPISAGDIEQQRKIAWVLIERFRADGDPDLIQGLVEGETELFEALEAATQQVFADDALISAIKEQMAKLAERKKRLEDRRERIKDAIFDALTTLQSGAQLPSATLSLSALPFKVNILDPADLPQGFYEEALVRTPRLPEIKKALLAGQEVPGAEAAPPGKTLNIRRT